MLSNMLNQRTIDWSAEDMSKLAVIEETKLKIHVLNLIELDQGQ